jgi:hypothetical protein
MRPATRHSLPEWEVSFDRQVIGYVRERHHKSIIFYEAIGIHPTTGDRVSLELSTEREERIEVVLGFWRDPTSCKQHLPSPLKVLHGLA